MFHLSRFTVDSRRPVRFPHRGRAMTLTGFGLISVVLGMAASTMPTNAHPGSTSQDVVVKPRGSQPSTKGAAECFTGSVRIDPLFDANEASRTSGAYVTFEPGAR